MEMVVRECEERSLMTNRFSKRKFRKFRNWFFKKGKLHFQWNKWQCQKEFDRFIEAFNVKIE